MKARPMNGLNMLLCRMWVAPVIAMAMLAVATWAPAPVAAAVSSDEAARKVAAEYSVKVLRVRAAVLDNTPVWLITIMMPGSDNNDAFQVNTLAVDQESGELVPAFRHGANGFSPPEGQARGTRLEQRPEAMRSGVWR